MHCRRIILLLYFTLVCTERFVIKSTPKLRQQGFHEDIDLGEVIAEIVVDFPEACGRLCEENPACHSVMLMGQLCRMFAPAMCQCSAELRLHAGGASRYLIGQDASVTSFYSAMAKCLSLGAHSVHINSQEEHDVIKQYILDSGKSGLVCKRLWTGGRSPISGSTDITDWRWYYTNNFAGPSEPFTYLAWGTGQPNNYPYEQYFMGLTQGVDYNFNDIGATNPAECHLCECP